MVEPSSNGTDRDLFLAFDQLGSLVRSIEETQSNLEEAMVRIDDEGKEILDDLGDLEKRWEADDLVLEGESYFNKGNYKEAIKKYDKALARHKDHGAALASKGFALRKLGESDRAMELLRRAVKLECDDFKLAQAYAVLGDRERTLDHLSRALKQHFEFARALYLLRDKFDQFRRDEAFVRILEDPAAPVAPPVV